MAEPGNETPPRPLPQETQTTDGDTTATDHAPDAPAAVAEASLEAAPPVSPAQDSETTGGGAAAVLDSALPRAESVDRAPPQETVDMAAVGRQPEQTTTEADGQPPVATTPEEVAALLPPPTEALAQESAVPAAPTPQPPPSQEQVHGKQPEPGLEEVATLPPPAEAPSQQGTMTAAEKQLAALPPHQPPEKQEGGALEQASSVQEEDKDAVPAGAPPARRRWRWLRAAVRLLFLRPQSKETKPPVPGVEEKKPTAGEMRLPLPKDSGAVHVPSSKPEAEKGELGEVKPSAQEEQKPKALKKLCRKHSAGAAAREEKDEGEGSKGRRDETPQRQGERALLKKLQKVGKLVQVFMSLYNKHRRSHGQEIKPVAATTAPDEEKGSEAKPAMDGKQLEEEEKKQKEKQHPNWPREEVRLERILEEAFTRLLVREYKEQLTGMSRKCLLTFSVFDLAAEVKKQAMVYWWVAEFNLRHRSDPTHADEERDDAEGIFLKLSDGGFLMARKNWCSKVIHGCQVNPLVHWMLKRQARGDCFAELDQKGCPEDMQLDSSILCLTAGNRCVLQKMRMEDESLPQTGKKEKRQPSQQAQGKGNHVQQPTTKDEAQVGSKSKAVDKAPSQQDPTQDQDQLTQQTTTTDKVQVGNNSKAINKTPSQQGSTQVKDQLTQQPTTLVEAQVGNNSKEINKAPSQKNTTKAKDHLTQGLQNTQPGPDPEHVSETEKQLFKGKRVILNVNAHVYPISKSAFLHLAECLVVLQLGRWNNLDDTTYMEVDGLQSHNAIGQLKNLRYLGLRGLSRLTELPKGIESLKKLVILDMRGCQNLVRVAAKATTQLKHLTHLDLTECYMLEHIGRGITSLSELQVLKGFVFATGTQGNRPTVFRRQDLPCRIQDLRRLKKLQKLTISITTDANVGKGEMEELQHLTSLQKLTITWGEIPSILEVETEQKKRDALVQKWTSFKLPKDLIKLDIRCYPKKVLVLERHDKLEKLYLRGGDKVERFSAGGSESIRTLRLRYLENFQMKWEEIKLELKKIESVEIKGKIDEVTKDKKDIEKEAKLKLMLKIPDFTLDQHGVWTKDEKEEENNKSKEATKTHEDQDVTMEKSKASGPSGPTEDSTNGAANAITNVNKDDDKAATKEQAAKEEQVGNIGSQHS